MTTVIVDPWTTPLAFRTLYLLGLPAPGVIPEKGGITGFKLVADLDKKKGKGKDGATVTDNGDKPIEGAVKLHVWTKDQYQAYGPFKDAVLAARKANKAIDVVHPTINAADVPSVMVEEFGPLMHEGKFLWSYELKLVKWSAQPKDAGGTPDGSKDKKGLSSDEQALKDALNAQKDPNYALKQQRDQLQHQADNLPTENP